MLSKIHLPLIMADCDLSTRKSITLLNLEANNLDRIFRTELMRLMGIKSARPSKLELLGIRAMLDQFIYSKLIDPLWKLEYRVRTSFSIIFQNFWKIEMGKLSGPGALSAPRSKTARLISSREKGASKAERFGRSLLLNSKSQENRNLDSFLVPKIFWKWVVNTFLKFSYPST